MSNINPLEYAGCQFDIVTQAHTLAFMQNENISSDTVRQVVSKALPMLFNSYSDKRQCLRSRSNDLCILCKCHYTEKKHFTVEVNFVFKLSAESLNFSYQGKKIHIFYTPGHFNLHPGEVVRQRPRGESALFKKYKIKKKYPRVVCEASIKMDIPKNEFIPADGLVTVLTNLDALIVHESDEDFILSDIITLCLNRYKKNDTLQLEILAAPLKVFTV